MIRIIRILLFISSVISAYDVHRTSAGFCGRVAKSTFSFPHFGLMDRFIVCSLQILAILGF